MGRAAEEHTRRGDFPAGKHPRLPSEKSPQPLGDDLFLGHVERFMSRHPGITTFPPRGLAKTCFHRPWAKGHHLDTGLPELDP